MIDTQRLATIFMPRAMAEATRFYKEPGANFVHYTSADNAIKIISNRALWMRNARCMNDYSEIEHGKVLLEHSLNENDRRAQLFELVAKCNLAAANEARGLLDRHFEMIPKNTFISCLSEHPSDEDICGRLSMWRAYGAGTVGVAVVLNKEVLFRETNALNVWSSPVAYLSQTEVTNELDAILANIRRESSWLASLPSTHLALSLFKVFLFGISCLKHHGFREEREWRIIHVPPIHPSTALKQAIESIGGVPQPVIKIPLDRLPYLSGTADFSVNTILHHLIVGPTSYPNAVRDALVATLKSAGVKDADRKVLVSDVPLRT